MRLVPVILAVTLLLTSCSSPGVRRLGQALDAAHFMMTHPNRKNFRLFETRASSMSPAINPQDETIVDMRAYSRKRPARGDIVVFRLPDYVLMAKRVVAEPDDRVSITGGRLYVNGKLFREPYIKHPTPYDLELDRRFIFVRPTGTRTWMSVQQWYPSGGAVIWRSPDRVPPEYYVVLGDNRTDSADSHTFGFVPASTIKGKVVEVLHY